MLLRLICVDAVASQSEFVIRQFPVSIGRGSEADLVINDSWASRRNCEIDCDEGCLTVRDLASRNGTRVNGELIHESPLLPGDELTVGISTFLISLPTSESSFIGHPALLERSTAMA